MDEPQRILSDPVERSKKGEPLRIVNGTAVEIHYEIKGGPLRMTMSTCDLLPGEEEVWRQPYRGLMPECEVYIEVGGQTLRATVPADATVRVTDAGIDVA